MAKVYHSATCPSCGKPAAQPFRSYDQFGATVSGCVDFFHGGHLTQYSEASYWHFRPEAKKIRAAQRKARGGCVTVAIEQVAA